MQRYNTPSNIVQIISNYLQNGSKEFLEPSVGTGVLLDSLISNIHNIKRIVCLDIDKEIIPIVRAKYEPVFGEKLYIENANFLNWSINPKKNNLFDCVIMNPPFSNRSSNLIKMKLEDFGDNDLNITRAIPYEAAFIINSIKLLKPKGKLFAIIPSSMISSIKLAWLRSLLMKMGNIQYVHQFPSFSFESVEASPYLFVYQKSSKQGRIKLVSHKNGIPSTFSISSDKFNQNNRLDYDYHESIYVHQSSIANFPNLEWHSLKYMAKVFRGNIVTPFKSKKKPIHSTDFNSDGFWYPKKQKSSLMLDNSEYGIKETDILVKRVGRSCSQSVGTGINTGGLAVSDCVLIIRPFESHKYLELLFCLRIILSNEFGKKIIERGTGVKFLAQGDVNELQIPSALTKCHQKHFNKYITAVKEYDIYNMKKIEEQLRYKYKMAPHNYNNQISKSNNYTTRFLNNSLNLYDIAYKKT